MAERRRIPEFKTLDEMARFWDEHDVTEFAHEGPEDVTYRPKRVVLSVRFDFEDFVELSRQARRMGMDRSTLVRMIVKRALHGSGDEAAGPEEGSPLGAVPEGRRQDDPPLVVALAEAAAAFEESLPRPEGGRGPAPGTPKPGRAHRA